LADFEADKRKKNFLICQQKKRGIGLSNQWVYKVLKIITLFLESKY